MSIQCEFCSTLFKETKVMRKHQKTAAYCLQKQKEKLNLKCVCLSTFLLSEELETHRLTCVLELNRQISELKTFLEVAKNQSESYRVELEKSQKLIEEIAKAPKTVNNTTTNNNNDNKRYMNLTAFNYTKDEIKEIVKNDYTEKHIKEGIDGFTKFAYSHIVLDKRLEPRYTCSNYDEMIFKYKNDKNEIVMDIGARDLCIRIFQDGNVRERTIEMFEKLLSNESNATHQKIYKDYQSEILALRNAPELLGKYLRVYVRNGSDSLKQEAKAKYDRIQQLEDEEREYMEEFKFDCDDCYDYLSVCEDEDDDKMEKSILRRNVRMQVRNYDHELRRRFDEIRTFNAGAMALEIKKKLDSGRINNEIYEKYSNQLEKFRKIQNEYLNGTLDLTTLSTLYN